MKVLKITKKELSKKVTQKNLLKKFYEKSFIRNVSLAPVGKRAHRGLASPYQIAHPLGLIGSYMT